MTQFNVSQTVLKYLFVAACCIQLGGCASYHSETRSVYQNSSSDWRAPKDDHHIGELVFKDMEIKENYFSVNLNKVERDMEYSSDIYRKEIKTRRDPDLGKILISTLLLWTPCLVDTSLYNTCFGGSGRWLYLSEEVKNTHPTGNTRPATRPLKKNYNALVALIAYDHEKQPRDRGYVSVSSKKSAIRFDLKSALETLPNKPDSLDIAIDISINGQSYYKKWPIPQPQLVAILADSECWLPISVRKERYMDALRAALINDDHSEAVIQFEKMENLGIPLPESFYFKYGLSLSKAGHSDKANKYFTRYISNAGQTGKYYSQAVELLNN